MRIFEIDRAGVKRTGEEVWKRESMRLFDSWWEENRVKILVRGFGRRWVVGRENGERGEGG